MNFVSELSLFFYTSMDIFAVIKWISYETPHAFFATSEFFMTPPYFLWTFMVFLYLYFVAGITNDIIKIPPLFFQTSELCMKPKFFLAIFFLGVGGKHSLNWVKFGMTNANLIIFKIQSVVKGYYYTIIG